MKKFLSIVMMISIIISMVSCSSNSKTKQVGENEKGSTESSTSTSEVVTWKFGNQHNSTQIATIIDKEIAEEIEQATEGRVKIELYTDSSLGDYTSIFDELMLNTVQMANITGVDTYDARLNAAMIPYLMTSYEQCNHAYRPDGFIFSQVSEVLEGLNIRLMGFVPEDFVGIGTRKKIVDPEIPGKEKGILCRVPMLDVFALSTKDLGFRVSSIAYSDAYAALQTGVVDGMDGNGFLATCTAFGDVINYFYDYRHLCEATMILISQEAWDGISKTDQDIISEIIYKKCQEIPKRAEKLENEYMEKMKEEYGIEIIRFTKEELESFAESCRKNVWPELAKSFPEGFLEELLKDIKQ